MMLGINARAEDLKEQLINDINRAKMPACILDYLLTEILADVRRQRAGEVVKERKKYKEETTPVPGEVPAAGKEEGADDNNNPDS